jgi:hypothetical protein
MSAANDNGGTVRDLGLPAVALAHFNGPFDPFDMLRVSVSRVRGPVGAVAVGGLHHAATVTLRTLAPSSGKSSGFTGSNLRPAPADINAVAGALAAMLAELPPRGTIVDRLS